jgi:asparagine synthase (glutamine-hydrolysing)
MCGINFIHFKNDKGDSSFIEKMNKATQHRGPDATKYISTPFQNGFAYLGHNRLRILDLSENADQPFVSDCKNYFLVFNGEISNYKKLKSYLETTYQVVFKTNSDTEVLFQLLIHEKIEGIKKLEGMFAFVFLSVKDNSLIVGRDNFGIKPLYYFENDNYLVISSEIKGILATGLVKKELNESQINHYLTFRYAQKPQTFFKHIFEIEPFFQENKENTETENEELFLESDVPMGLFMSGGIDSSYLAVVAKRDYGISLPCFTVVDKENIDSDFDFIYSEKITKELKIPHEPLFLDESIYSEWEKFVEITDQPISDPASILAWKLSEHAKKHVSVALSGAGADELYGGYNRHKAFQKYLNYKPFLLALKPYLLKYFKNKPNYSKFLHSINESEFETFINFTKLFTDFPTSVKVQKPLDNNFLFWALKFDIDNYLFSDVLAITDRYSMQHALEVRVPFLHKYPTGFPKNLGKEKLVFRLQNEGFKYLNYREKTGFGIQLKNWMQSPIFKDLVKKYLQDERLIIYNYVSLELVTKQLEEFYIQNKDNSQQIWALLLLSSWIEKEFN